jgi:hypothetical protein
MMIGAFLLIAGCIVYYRVGQHEWGAGFTAAGFSAIAWIVTWLWLGWGLLGYCAGQLALLAGMTWYNMRRNSK